MNLFEKMNRVIFTSSLFLFAIACKSQESSINLLSSAISTNKVVFTVGDIHINDQSGALGIYSFQLFDETSVNVEAFLNADIKVFPNPSNGFFTVSADEKITSIRLLDMNGKVVMTNKDSKNINLSKMESGTYIVLVNEKKAIKIIKP